MNLNRLISFCLVFSFKSIFSQEINLGPRITALGNSGVALQDIWNLQSNQAGLAALKKPVAAIAYQSNYLSTELSTQSAALAYPFKSNMFGLSLQNYGFSAYNEQKIGLSYAKSFGKTVFLALNFNLHQVKIQQYGTAQTYSVEAGFQFQANEKLLLGTHISNPNKSAYDHEVNAFIPTVLEVGASYKFSDKVLLNSGLIKDLSSLTDVRFGLEYSIIDWFSLRGGINTNPFRQFFGFGCSYQRLRIDAAAASHPNLGYSPQLALSYEF